MGINFVRQYDYDMLVKGLREEGRTGVASAVEELLRENAEMQRLLELSKHSRSPEVAAEHTKDLVADLIDGALREFAKAIVEGMTQGLAEMEVQSERWTDEVTFDGMRQILVPQVAKALSDWIDA